MSKKKNPTAEREPAYAVLRVRRDDYKTLCQLSVSGETSLVDTFAMLVKEADRRRRAEARLVKTLAGVLP